MKIKPLKDNLKQLDIHKFPGESITQVCVKTQDIGNKFNNAVAFDQEPFPAICQIFKNCSKWRIFSSKNI